MLDAFRRAFLVGLGAMSLTRERAQQIIDELVKAGEVQEQEGKDLMDEMLKKAAEVKDDVQKTVTSQLDAAYKRLNLVSVDQLKKMEKRIQELERELRSAA